MMMMMIIFILNEIEMMIDEKENFQLENHLLLNDD